MSKKRPTENKPDEIPEYTYKNFKDDVDFLVSNGFITNDDKLPKIMLESYVGIHVDVLYNIHYAIHKYKKSPTEKHKKYINDSISKFKEA